MQVWINQNLELGAGVARHHEFTACQGGLLIKQQGAWAAPQSSRAPDQEQASSHSAVSCRLRRRTT